MFNNKSNNKIIINSSIQWNFNHLIDKEYNKRQYQWEIQY
jgi:hypothetical protein